MAFFNINDAYRILGLESGADIKEVKKAYAALIKQYHPEEHPEEWKKIHDAYTFLCNWLNRSKTPSADPNSFAFDPASSESDNAMTDPYLFDDITGKSGSINEKDEEQILLDNLLNEAKKENGAAAFGSGADSARDREYFSDIMAQLEKLQSPDIVVYGKPAIKVESFMALHNHEKYEQAMLYPEFVSHFTEVLGKSCPDPDIRSYLEGDVVKIARAGIDRERVVEYNKLLTAARSAATKDGFMATVGLEEDKKTGNYAKRFNPPAARWGLGILAAIMVIMKSCASMYNSQHSTPQLPPSAYTVTQVELPEPVAMVANAENAEMEDVLKEYETFLDECRDFFEKYDIEDYSDPDVRAQYFVLMKKKMQIVMYELSYKPDLSTEEGRKTDRKMTEYHAQMEEIWEDWTDEEDEDV